MSASRLCAQLRPALSVSGSPNKRNMGPGCQFCPHGSLLSVPGSLFTRKLAATCPRIVKSVHVRTHMSGAHDILYRVINVRPTCQPRAGPILSRRPHGVPFVGYSHVYWAKFRAVSGTCRKALFVQNYILWGEAARLDWPKL